MATRTAARRVRAGLAPPRAASRDRCAPHRSASPQVQGRPNGPLAPAGRQDDQERDGSATAIRAPARMQTVASIPGKERAPQRGDLYELERQGALSMPRRRHLQPPAVSTDSRSERNGEL